MEQHAHVDKITNNRQASYMRQGGGDIAVEDHYFSAKDYKALSQDHHIDLKGKR